MKKTNTFLPISKKDMQSRGWSELDIILITGDAYVDHPSYGTAVIGRVLEDAGYKVGVISQPDINNLEAFKVLGRPKLFFGVTAGNLDSMVANYTANKKIRSNDEYTPGGLRGKRPDRATMMYTNKIRQAYKGVCVVLGGLEATLRCLAHYDYWSEKVRRSILFDAKADILVFGMGEKSILEIARRKQEEQSLDGIPGTAVIIKEQKKESNVVVLPSFEKVQKDKKEFVKAFNLYTKNSEKILLQEHAGRYLCLYPREVYTSADLDKIYDLPYVRKPHPSYGKNKITGFETVKFSVVSHRGCFGECSFCSITLNQGRMIVTRSLKSILKEVDLLASFKDFKGTITDIGGPTANMAFSECDNWKKGKTCKNKSCIVPQKCPSLRLGYGKIMDMWREVAKNRRIKHVFVGSGIRFDLLLDKKDSNFFKELCGNHVSGRMKVAPENFDDNVLKLMQKPTVKVYEMFIEKFNAFMRKEHKKQYAVNYIICSHPGTDLKSAYNTAVYLKRNNLKPEQVQDFLPSPMTASTCMYYTGIDPRTGKKVYVARGEKERKMQRALIQYFQPQNKKLINQALRILGKRSI